MTVAVLNIGSELLLGRVANTNLVDIAKGLANIGLEVVAQITVADAPKAIERAIKDLLKQADCLITTGGLGPTADDLTLELFAKLLGKKLKYNAAVLADLNRAAKDRGIAATPYYLRQAAYPQGTQPIANQVGRALGLHIKTRQFSRTTKHIFVLPGVPAEMRGMLNDYLLPTLTTIAGKKKPPVELFTCRFLGVPESIIDHTIRAWQLETWVNRPTKLEWGVMMRYPEVHLICRLYSSRDSAKVWQRLRAQCQKELNDCTVAFDGDLPEQSVHSIFSELQATLAVAESCTGGTICSRLLALPKASAFFLGGAVTYSNDAKTELLGVPPTILSRHGAVSPECALAMAQGAASKLQSDYAVAVTGILGPDGGTYDKPVGLVHIAYVAAKDPGAAKVITLHLKRDRLMNREETVATTLVRLKKFVEENKTKTQ